jgi:hypothetical protein
MCLFSGFQTTARRLTRESQTIYPPKVVSREQKRYREEHLGPKVVPVFERTHARLSARKSAAEERTRTFTLLARRFVKLVPKKGLEPSRCLRVGS